MTHYDPIDLRCSDCGEPPGQPCHDRILGTPMPHSHLARKHAAAAATVRSERRVR